ncbi:hypothetical protein MMC26_005254 [Xylographa opegraphella]|nr:hypothetical protein [Xylographa opegraphella]
MLSASLLSVVLALLSFSTVQAVPLPLDCTCGNSPLSARTVDYIFQVTKARHLTPEECAFLCNPSPHRQQQTIMSADSKVTNDPLNFSSETSPVTSSTSSSMDSSPPATGPYLKATTSPLPSFSQVANPAAVEPPTTLDHPANRKDRHRPQPAPLPSNHHAGQVPHSRAQSTLSPQRKAFLPCALRVGGSLIMLFIIAVCVVEICDALVLLYRRRVRGRGYSNSGRLRLDEEETSEKNQRDAWRPWRR